MNNKVADRKQWSPNPLVVLIGPSGVGKSSFLDHILKEQSHFCDIMTYTTRPMRADERQGFPYHFVTRQQFEELITKGFFVEWAHVHGNLYGTPSDQIEAAWQKGQVVIMDLDVQGALEVKRKYPQAVTVFLLPPSLDALRKRLEGRNMDRRADMDLRIQNAQGEMLRVGEFDYQIVNGDFQVAFEEFRHLLRKHNLIN